MSGGAVGVGRGGGRGESRFRDDEVGEDEAVVVDWEAATVLGVDLEVEEDLVEDGGLTGSDGESAGDLVDGVSGGGRGKREREGGKSEELVLWEGGMKRRE